MPQQRIVRPISSTNDYDGVEAFLSGGGSLSVGDVWTVAGADGDTLAAGTIQPDDTAASGLKRASPLRFSGLASGDGYTETLTNGATSTITAGDGYIDIAITGTGATSLAVYDLDVFGDGGATQRQLREVYTTYQLDPGTSDTYTTGGYFGIDIYNPAVDYYVGAYLRYTGTQWDRYLIYDIGAGEVEFATFSGGAVDVSGLATMGIHHQSRNQSTANVYHSYNTVFTGYDGANEAGQDATNTVTDWDAAAQSCRTRIRIRPNGATTTTLRIYRVGATDMLGQLDPTS